MSSELLFTVLLLLAASFSLLQLGAFSGLLIRSPARHDADWWATAEVLGPGGPGELQHSDEQHSDEQHSDEQHSDEQHSDEQLGNPGTDPSRDDSPADHVPERVHAPVGHLEVGHAVKIRDLELPEGVRAVLDAEETVVTCTIAGKKAAEEAAAGTAEPEVIGRKAEEEEAGAAEEA
jgi:hypothetical protein